jgi:GT2 family glycosyltransferase
MTSSISVIIPSYNGKELLSENLPYVLKSLDCVDRYEIIVVDDASNDNSVEYLRINFPAVRIIRNDKNQGFARSINRGIKEARFDLIFLLNNDIKPDKKYVYTSLRFFKRSNTFGVMGIIKDELTNKILEGIKYPVVSLSGLKYRDIRSKKIEQCSNEVYTFYLCGGNTIADRKKILELDGLLEIYEPFYQEDVDLSVRAWLSGWKLYFNSGAICYHKHSATIKKYYRSDYIRNISKRNRLIISYIYLQGYIWKIFNFVTVIKSLYYGFLFSIKSQSVNSGYQEFLKLKYNLQKYRSTYYKISDLNHLIKDIQRNIKKNLADIP